MPVESYADYYLSVHRFATFFLLVQFLPINTNSFLCDCVFAAVSVILFSILGSVYCFCLAVSYAGKFKPHKGSPVLPPTPPPLEPQAGIFVKRQFQYRFLEVESHAKRGNNLDRERVRFPISISFFFLSFCFLYFDSFGFSYFKEGIVFVTSDWARIYFMSFYIVMMVSQYDCLGFDLLNRRSLLPGARTFAVSDDRMLNQKPEPHAEFSARNLGLHQKDCRGASSLTIVLIRTLFLRTRRIQC